MSKNVINYSKIVRDKIPEIINQAGKEYEIDYVSDSKKWFGLSKKT